MIRKASIPVLKNNYILRIGKPWQAILLESNPHLINSLCSSYLKRNICWNIVIRMTCRSETIFTTMQVCVFKIHNCHFKHEQLWCVFHVAINLRILILLYKYLYYNYTNPFLSSLWLIIEFVIRVTRWVPHAELELLILS
jgi:hypothetical protein